MDIKKMAFPAIYLVLSACTSGHVTSFLPSPGRYSCDGLDFTADSNTVEESYWGQVFIPIFKYDKDNTHEGVTVDFFVRSERAIKLTENDIYIEDFESGLKKSRGAS